MTFTCPQCARTSHHPEDARQGYCGACHDWTGEPSTPRADGPIDSPTALGRDRQV